MSTAVRLVAKRNMVELPKPAVSQARFLALCRLTDEPISPDAATTGDGYCSDKSAVLFIAATKGLIAEVGISDVWNRRFHVSRHHKGPRSSIGFRIQALFEAGRQALGFAANDAAHELGNQLPQQGAFPNRRRRGPSKLQLDASTLLQRRSSNPIGRGSHFREIAVCLRQ